MNGREHILRIKPFTAFALAVFILSPNKVLSQETPRAVETVDLASVITSAAAEYGLNAREFLAVADCEDPGLVVDQQSNVIRKDGTREPSFGIFQIDLDENPGVTREEAEDPAWAAKWAAEQWSAGHADRWTCFRYLYG